MENKIIVSPSPHIHSKDSISKNMYGVLIALIPAFMVMLYQFGWSSLLITILAVVSCMLTEGLITKYMMRRPLKIMDGSALLTGVLLAFNLPPSIPWYLVVLGSIVAIGIGKMAFGGLGNNIFNPALLGRVFLLISYPAQMTSWGVPNQLPESLMTDATTMATPLGIMKGVMHGTPGMSLDQIPDSLSLFLGLNPGSIGEISAVALLIGLIYLLAKKIITWHTPISIMATVVIISGIMHLIQPNLYPTPLFHLLTGGLMLGAIFMATDYVTSPITTKGQIIYGVGIGLITVVIRTFGAYPEGVSFAILIMNATVPLINTYVQPTLFGAQKKKRKELKK